MGMENYQSDIGWIQKAAGGDREACRRLIEDNKRLVGHVVLRMCGRSADFEDLCQDVFLKVFSNLHSFQYNSKLSTWIARIAHNHCINFLRKRKVDLYEDFAPKDLTLDSLPGNTDTPVEIFEKAEKTDQIETAIAGLPEMMRMVITLFYVEQFSLSEICETLDLPENTVKSHLFRARKRLKTKLMEHEVFEDIVQ